MPAARRSNICRCDKQELSIHTASCCAPSSLGSPNCCLLPMKNTPIIEQAKCLAPCKTLEQSSSCWAWGWQEQEPPSLTEARSCQTVYQHYMMTERLFSSEAKSRRLHKCPAKTPSAAAPALGTSLEPAQGWAWGKALRHTTALPPLGTMPKKIFQSCSISLTFTIN